MPSRDMSMAEKKEDFELIRQVHTVLVLHFIEGMKQSDIAKKLNLSTSKVNRLITQGRSLGMVKIAIEKSLSGAGRPRAGPDRRRATRLCDRLADGVRQPKYHATASRPRRGQPSSGNHPRW